MKENEPSPSTGGTPAWARFEMTPELKQVLGLAVELNRKHPDGLALNFTSLLLALLAAPNPLFRWLNRLTGKLHRPNLESILAQQHMSIAQFTGISDMAPGMRDIPTDVAEKDISESARLVLGAAQSLRRSSSEPVDVRHLLGAFLYHAPSHRGQMEDWGFHFKELSDGFIQFIGRQHPDESKHWTKIVAQYKYPGLDKPAAAKTSKRAPKTVEPAAATPAGLEHSVLVRQILDASRKLVTAKNPSQSNLTTGAVFVAMLHFGARESTNNTRRFFFQHLQKSSGLEQSAAELEKLWLKNAAPDDSSPGQMIPVLARAETIARVLNGDAAVLAARHLLAALLTFQPASGSLGFHSLLTAANTSPDALRRDFLEIMLHDAPDQNKDAWLTVLGEVEQKAEPTPEPEDDAIALAGISTESPEGTDCLGVEREADGFAHLICSRELTPPLAIGLFGDWGSGKSFFMRKIQEAVVRVTDDARKGGEATGASAFYDDVVPIEFNAWHYVDTNLWASLVAHIFESLGQRFAVEKKEEWSELVRQLHTHNQLKAAAETELRAAEDARQKAAEELKQQEAALKNLKTSDLIASVLNNPELKQKISGAIAQIEEVFGAGGLRKVQTDWRQMLAEAKTLDGQLRVFRLALAQGPGARWRLGLIAAVLAAVAAVPLILPHFAADDFTRRISVYIGELVALAGGVIGWVTPALKKASNVMSSLATLEAETARQENKDSTILQQAEADVAHARAELEQHNQQIQKLRSEIEALRPSQRLATFLRDRAESSDYRKHLGILALVRKDFDLLGDLMRQQRDDREIPKCTLKSFAPTPGANGKVRPPPELWTELAKAGHVLGNNAEIDEDEPGAAWRVLNPDGTANFLVRKRDAVFEVFAESRLPAIDRIVLYIDDLDRCPPRKVVEVLQAIHLMLAFRLFVVVVGVDARWIRHALRKVYPELLQDELDRRRKRKPSPDDESASPRDYLEKIFHIPFWLRPMDDTGREKLLADLLKDAVPKLPPPGAMQNAPAAPPGRPAPAASADLSGSTPTVPVLKADADGVTPAPGTTAPAAAATTPDAHAVQAAVAEVIALRARKVQLDPLELRVIQSLRRFTGRSPRSVKRFVNVYRLLRAGLTSQELDRLLGRNNQEPECHAILILLAVANSLPMFAPVLLGGLKELQSEGITFRQFLDRVPLDEQPAPWSGFKQWIDDYATQNKTALDCKAFSRWAPILWRYSFHYDRNDNGPEADRPARPGDGRERHS